MTTLEKFLEIEQLIEKHVHNPLVAGLLADVFAAQVTEIEQLKAEIVSLKTKVDESFASIWDEIAY
jgi:hypothetical protein